MHHRGDVYWGWADPEIHFRNLDERLSDRILINVQVRYSKKDETQLFVGVYGEEGAMLFEEAYDCRLGETMTQAMTWGVERAKELIVACSKLDSTLGPLPRAGSNMAERRPTIRRR